MPSAIASTASVNNSREPVRAIRSSTHGTTRVPTGIAAATNIATFASVSASASQALLPDTARPTAPAGSPPNVWRGRQQDQRQHHRRSSTISQPTAMRPSADSSLPCRSSARSSTTVLATESASSEGEPGRQRPSPEARKQGADQRRGQDLADCAGNRDAANRQQVADREVQADAEHQQDHADLGKLLRERDIADERLGPLRDLPYVE